MKSAFFKHTELLSPPLGRAAYSDRTAWLTAVMSRLAYLKFERDDKELRDALAEAGFELAETFNANGTQAYLALRKSDEMAVLAFRGTETEALEDIVTDLQFRFYRPGDGSRIHSGFYAAYQRTAAKIETAVREAGDYSLYITGHSLGGALALLAARALASDAVAACYTFGSPRIACGDFGDEIKIPIYRVVNACDPVPFLPPSTVVDFLAGLKIKELRKMLAGYRGYTHHGDQRFLTPCQDYRDVRMIPNYDDYRRLWHTWLNRRQAACDHRLDIYCEKLAHWALGRLETS